MTSTEGKQQLTTHYLTLDLFAPYSGKFREDCF